MKKSSSGFFSKFRLKSSPKPKHKPLKADIETETISNTGSQEAIENTEYHEVPLNTELDSKEQPYKSCIKLEGRQSQLEDHRSGNMEKHEVR